MDVKPDAALSLPRRAPGGLAYEVLGERGPWLLAVHGGPGMDHASLRPWLDPLAQRARLVYFDLPGHGQSEAPADYQLDTMADAVDALAEHLGAEHIVLLGHSYGGFVSLTCALRHPQRVSRMVLVDTAASSGFRAESLEVAQRRATPDMLQALDRLWTDTLTNDVEFARDWRIVLPLYFHHLSRAEIGDSAADLSFRLATRKAVLPTFADYDLTARLADIRAPALVTVGRHDWITSVGQAEVLANGLRTSRLDVLEHSGHLPFVEEPQRFLSVVNAWLDEEAPR
jgi:proline iminopeptidase